MSVRVQDSGAVALRGLDARDIVVAVGRETALGWESVGDVTSVEEDGSEGGTYHVKFVVRDYRVEWVTVRIRVGGCALPDQTVPVSAPACGVDALFDVMPWCESDGGVRSVIGWVCVCRRSQACSCGLGRRWSCPTVVIATIPLNAKRFQCGFATGRRSTGIGCFACPACVTS